MSRTETRVNEALLHAERNGLIREYRLTLDGALRFDLNDYFALRRHPLVLDAAREALARFGAGAGASRAAGGDCPLYGELERRLAERYGYPACLLTGAGYLANVGTLAALAGPRDLILADKLSHASLLDGIRLSGAAWTRFLHNDLEHLEALLRAKRGEADACFIVCETIYGMDGDAAPLAKLGAIAAQYDATVIADHAHGPGFVRPSFHEAEILTGTLSKAYGSYGGYVCCSEAVRRYLIQACRPALFSTAMPPANAATALAAMDVLEREPERILKARQAALYFAEAAGAPVPEGAVVPVILGGNERTLQAGAMLEQAGIRCGAIRPPSVPPGTARLRFAFSADHDKKDIDILTKILKTVTAIPSDH